jgi:NAD(P)-dependent dehydrogenase (short-subunit alcohol dehydrogenase family)
VALLARSAEQLDGTSREIHALGGSALMFRVDVADSEAVFAAADELVKEWGRIDVWVNNAMVTVYAPIDDMMPDEFKRVTEVTYLGTVYGTLAALRHMRPANAGTIVQIGSALSYRSIPLQSAYCAAKFAIRGFTDSLRSELAHAESDIRVTMVQLPAVNTPQFDWARSRLPRRLQPVPPIYQPEAVAKAIIQAAARAPRELWVGIPAIRAIVGTMVAPGLLDWLAKTAWEGQMTEEPALPARSDNLFEPVPVDIGTHGRFDARSKNDVIAFSGRAVRAALAVSLLLLITAIFAWGWG